MTYKVILEPEAEDDLKGISDVQTRRVIRRAVAMLATEPEKRGKPLKHDLLGHLSLRCAGQRYRALYYIDNVAMRVVVWLIGIRKAGDKRDAYRLAQKRVP